MKKFLSFLFIATIVVSCSKKDLLETQPAATYLIRVAAIANDGSKTFTPISKVKSGKVAVEFETADVSDIREFNVEVSSDGINFSKLKTIEVDVKNPNKVYNDTVVLE